jgi:hypothetical protein
MRACPLLALSMAHPDAKEIEVDGAAAVSYQTKFAAFPLT